MTDMIQIDLYNIERCKLIEVLFVKCASMHFIADILLWDMSFNSRKCTLYL